MRSHREKYCDTDILGVLSYLLNHDVERRVGALSTFLDVLA
jgi:hypothetical protein